MTINQLHEPMQSAYRACHSTETALVRVQNDILRTPDQGGAAILVLLDLSAAFDTIDHSILLSRMESVLGVKGSALQWFKSYLLGRKQRIKINDDFSENQEILWSVPQGSVLGALLFLIYIIPLAQLIRSYGLNNHGYADDTQLCLSFKKTSDNALLIGIQQDLIAKLQRLQNSAARIVSRTRKYEHITPVPTKLHWLPIKFRIQFKVLLLVYKALNGLAPKYIKELLVPYKPRRHLRSEAKGLLDEPRTRLKFGDRAFSISAPRLWNALPQHLKGSTSCQAFKKCLKTHLFRLAH